MLAVGEHNMATRERDAESTIALLRRLMNELSTLVRQEIALASAEVSRSIRMLVASAASVAIGGLVLYAGALVLLAAAVLGLANVVAPWLAALIVGVAVGIIGYVMVHAGLRKMKVEHLKPERVQESLRRDKEVLTRHTP
jgi:Putative Actinobacterial Holin-X, holin superfamily III